MMVLFYGHRLVITLSALPAVLTWSPSTCTYGVGQNVKMSKHAAISQQRLSDMQ